MREESHLEDMRAALRGDFERLRERRGTQELMQPPPARVEPEIDAPLDDSASPVPQRPWLARILGRPS
jgi:hypothetical protein